MRLWTENPAMGVGDGVIQGHESSFYITVRQIRSLFKDFAIAALFGVFPLFILEGRYEDLSYIRSIFLHRAAIILFVAALILGVLERVLSKRQFSFREAIRGISFPDIAIVAYLIIACLSAYRSDYPHQVLYGVDARYDGIITQASYIALYFVFSRFYRVKPWHFYLLGLSACLVCIIGIAQFFGYDFLELDPSGMTYHRRMFFTTFGHFDVTATFASMMSVLFAALTIVGRKPRSYIFLLPTALCFVMQIILDTMSGWVAIVGCGFIAIPVFLRTKRSFLRTMMVIAVCGCAGTLYIAVYRGIVLRSAAGYEAFLSQYLYMFVAAMVLFLLFAAISHGWKGDHRLHIAWILLVYAVAAAALGYAYMKLRTVDGRGNLFYEIDQVLHGNFDDGYGSTRGYIWKRGLTLVALHPWIGTGADTFGNAFYSLYGEESYMLYRVVFDKAHNEYLQILVTHGILGLGAYAAFLVGYFILAIRHRRAIDESVVGHGLLLMTIAYLIQAIFTFSIPIVTPFYAIAVGCVSSICRGDGRRKVRRKNVQGEDHALRDRAFVGVDSLRDDPVSADGQPPEHRQV